MRISNTTSQVPDSDYRVRARERRNERSKVCMLQQLLYVALTVLILGLTLYVLLENSRKQDAKLRKRLRSGGAS